ncbi:chromatin complexes subunit BAP18 [Ditylenchus destructor]|uniref:Chromatin complexes subunit BAP18 n=1 Tax=Ditylenchus destructor TaxID=166010 RepID=A0AAD4NI48_9BILA|nr:chromatin complexes subunit BAP18 [Ditylenchus destructor]
MPKLSEQLKDLQNGGRIVSRPTPPFLGSSRPIHTPATTNSTAVRVSEVFLTAAHAFQKLGDLILPLNAPIAEGTDNNKWSERDVDRLKEALSRFAQELDSISDSVQARIVRHMKTDIKRASIISHSDMRTPLNYTNISGSNSTPQLNSTAITNINSGSSQMGETIPHEPELESYGDLSPSQQQFTSSPPRLQQEHSAGPVRTRVVHLSRTQNQQPNYRPGTTLIKRQAPQSNPISNSYGGGSGVMYSSGNGAPPLKKPIIGSNTIETSGMYSNSGHVQTRQGQMGPSTTFRPVNSETSMRSPSTSMSSTRVATRSSDAAAANSNQSMRAMM